MNKKTRQNMVKIVTILLALMLAISLLGSLL